MAGVRWAAAYVAAMPHLSNVAALNARLDRGCMDELERIWAADPDATPVPVLRVPRADAAAAAGEWLASVEESGTTFCEFSPALKAALASADLPVGGWWVPRDGEPITAVQAHTMAVWAAWHAPVPERRRENWIV